MPSALRGVLLKTASVEEATDKQLFARDGRIIVQVAAGSISTIFTP